MAARVFALLALVASATATVTMYTAYLDGAQQNPAVTTTGQGWGAVWYDDVTLEANCTAMYALLTSGISLAHVHGPAAIGGDAGVLFTFTPGTDFNTGDTGASTTVLASTIGPKAFPITTHATELATQLLYYNVHTTGHGSGEIRGELYAQTYRFAADLSPDQQNPPLTNTMAHGKGWVTITPPTATTAPTATFSAYIWGLSGPVTVAHFHRGIKGANGGVTKDISSYVVGDAMFSWIPSTTITLSMDQYWWFLSGQIYFNFHTALNTAGEVRGQVWMAQSPAMSAGTYSLVASISEGGLYPCKARTTGGVTYYEDMSFQYQTSGFIVVYHALFSDSACSKFINAYTMNATLINAGVNQNLQRNGNNLDRFLLYPLDVVYKTTVSADAAGANAACNACAGDTLKTYAGFTVRRSCGRTNALACPLLNPFFMSGRVIDGTHVSFTEGSETSAAWATATYNDVSYSQFQGGFVIDFVSLFPNTASGLVPSMFVVVLAALVAVFH